MKVQEISRLFGGKIIGTRTMKSYICRTVAKFPPTIINKITKTCWFLGSTSDAWAYAFHISELTGKHIVILSDSLWEQPEHDIYYTIAHEIGHIILGHKNAILESQTKRETAQQEREARRFALEYI